MMPLRQSISRRLQPISHPESFIKMGSLRQTAVWRTAASPEVPGALYPQRGYLQPAPGCPSERLSDLSLEGLRARKPARDDDTAGRPNSSVASCCTYYPKALSGSVNEASTTNDGPAAKYPKNGGRGTQSKIRTGPIAGLKETDSWGALIISLVKCPLPNQHRFRRQHNRNS
jgi:hypothetical protein